MCSRFALFGSTIMNMLGCSSRQRDPTMCSYQPQLRYCTITVQPSPLICWELRALHSLLHSLLSLSHPIRQIRSDQMCTCRNLRLTQAFRNTPRTKGGLFIYPLARTHYRTVQQLLSVRASNTSHITDHMHLVYRAYINLHQIRHKIPPCITDFAIAIQDVKKDDIRFCLLHIVLELT